MRKCWCPAFSHFPTMFSKGLFLRVVKSRDSVVKELICRLQFFQFEYNIQSLIFEPAWREQDLLPRQTWKHHGKRRKCLSSVITPFPTMFSTLLMRNRFIWASAKFWLANLWTWTGYQNFYSFSYNVFYPYNEKLHYLCHNALNLDEAKINSSGKRLNQDRKHIVLGYWLTLQNFRLVQIESICRRQNRCNWKIEICFRKGGKCCGKRRKCWLPAFSPFPTMFLDGFFLEGGSCVAQWQSVWLVI